MAKRGHLVRAMSKYYKRAANGRVQFRNGLSLNHTAWRMSEVGQCETPPSTLSRILTGERLPTLCQFEALCEVLGLSERDAWELEYATLRDYCDRDGYELDISQAPPVVNLLTRNVEQLQRAIDEGEFDIAVDILRDFYLTRAGLEGTADPSIPMLRIISIVETERSLLMNALTRTAQEGVAHNRDLIQIPAVEEFDWIGLLDSIELSDFERRLARLYYVEGQSVDAIAESEEVTEVTVHSVLENVKQKLLQRLAEDPGEQPHTGAA